MTVLSAYKSTTTSRATTFDSDDPDLVIPVQANTTYLIEAFLRITTNTASGSWVPTRFRFSVPPSIVRGFYTFHRDVVDTDGTGGGGGAFGDPPEEILQVTRSLTTYTDYNGNTDGGFNHSIYGLITTGASTGTVAIRWGQTATSSDPAQLLAPSWLLLQSV
jgi:hypothetical protein